VQHSACCYWCDKLRLATGSYMQPQTSIVTGYHHVSSPQKLPPELHLHQTLMTPHSLADTRPKRYGVDQIFQVGYRRLFSGVLSAVSFVTSPLRILAESCITIPQFISKTWKFTWAQIGIHVMDQRSHRLVHRVHQQLFSSRAVYN
jgi:hypothetical protein